MDPVQGLQHGRSCAWSLHRIWRIWHEVGILYFTTQSHSEVYYISLHKVAVGLADCQYSTTLYLFHYEQNSTLLQKNFVFFFYWNIKPHCIFHLFHSMKIWSLEEPHLREAISKSYSEPRKPGNQAFQTYTEQIPLFSSTDVHTGYIGGMNSFD